MKRIFACLQLLIFLIPAAWAGSPCGSQVLVSDYRADNVLIFDGCDGSYVRNLDTGGRLDGPQALAVGPDGLLYVVSEENARVLRYAEDTLQFVDIFIHNDLGGVTRPVALAFGPDGDLLLAGFQSDNVGRFDGQTGAFKSIFVSAGSGGLDGPDAGMTIGPDGHLYVPGFRSDNVLRYDGQTGALIDEFISGIARPRVVLFNPEGTRLWVSSWGSSRVYEHEPTTGVLIGQFGNPVGTPTGMDFAANGDLLIANDQTGQVSRRDAQTGATLPNFISNGGTPLGSGTFVLTLGEDQEPQAAEATTNDQYWIIGLGDLLGESLTIGAALSSSGGVFGADFDPASIETPIWGSIVIDFTSCSTAELNYAAADNSKTFGAGGYSLLRVAPNAGQRSCEAAGFGMAADSSWASGAWFGGQERSGEGILIDVLEDDRTFIAWFTYGDNVNEQ